MTCDVCERRFDYCFYINDNHWSAAVGKREGHWCAHCILQELGGLDWYIVVNEQAAKIRTNVSTENERMHGQGTPHIDNTANVCYTANVGTSTQGAQHMAETDRHCDIIRDNLQRCDAPSVGRYYGDRYGGETTILDLCQRHADEFRYPPADELAQR